MLEQNNLVKYDSIFPLRLEVLESSDIQQYGKNVDVFNYSNINSEPYSFTVTLYISHSNSTHDELFELDLMVGSKVGLANQLSNSTFLGTSEAQSLTLKVLIIESYTYSKLEQFLINALTSCGRSSPYLSLFLLSRFFDVPELEEEDDSYEKLARLIKN